MQAAHPSQPFSGEWGEARDALAATARDCVDNIKALARDVGKSEAYVRKCLDGEVNLPLLFILRGRSQGREILRRVLSVSEAAPSRHPVDIAMRVAVVARELLDVVQRQTETAADGEWCRKDRAELRRELLDARRVIDAELLLLDREDAVEMGLGPVKAHVRRETGKERVG